MQQEVTQFFYTTEDNTTTKVRTWKDVDGAVWFVGKDVCEVLELADPTSACRGLDEDEILIRTISGIGSNRGVILMNESGLYSLIFTSRKPEAKRFRKWVTSEVLPRLRETGHYETPKVKEKHLVPVTKQEALKTVKRSSRGIPQGVMKAAEKVLARTGLDDFQMTLALDKVVQAYTGESILEITGIRAVENYDFDMNKEEGIWTRRSRWHWEHDYPTDSNDWGPLGFEEDGTYYPMEG